MISSEGEREIYFLGGGSYILIYIELNGSRYSL